MMKKIMLICALGLFIAHHSYAQMREDPGFEEKKGFDKSKLFVGGNFGLSFGDYTIANVSPQLGYRFNTYLAAGVGVNFQYNSIKYRYTNGDAESKAGYGVTGLNIFGRFYPIPYIMVQAQPEFNYTWGKYKFYDNRPNVKIPGKVVPSMLLGGGAVIPSGNGSLVLMVQFDVLNQARSPYGTRPIYNFGYNIGL